MDIDIAHLKEWIGREDTASEQLTPAVVRRFAATLDLQADEKIGAPAPAMIHLCLGQPCVPEAALGPDGHPARGGFLPPVPLPRRMWAGGALVFHGPICVGDLVTRRSTITDVSLKQGRSGPLCFVTVSHEIFSNDRLALTERQDIVYRGNDTFPLTSSATAPPPAPAPQAEHMRQLTPTATLLFRYSALTFNGHRIHYDNPYATEVEGYPGLIVHGPLQATLLVQFAQALRNQPPARFSFRSTATIFDTADFTLNAETQGDKMALWVAQSGGPIAMQATAEW